ncbi:MAG: nickel pincer cofactor biosynthesis protein LarC [Pseudonocardiales bacterium]|nr:nickel pincer cofactor biosynthesis protein LarC [Actinomycetota bacterium]PZS21611.1 MAG: nickel pincer cofactor biosynthesis protein LarC [Pseudonocardiales bacterium]
MAEPTAVYLDCTAGVAGDMLLGALLDAGADLAAVRTAVRSLGVSGLDIELEQTRRCGLRCARAVVTTPAADQPTRGLAEVLAAIEIAPLSVAAARVAADTFRLLAGAEAAVHGIPAGLVHFHEVGAADALADVVGTAVAAEQLGLLAPDALVTCSALAAGSGTALSAHGMIPIPGPAVLQIVADRGLSLTGGNLTGERTTPTGAALVATLATPGPLPPMTVAAVGSGAGRRDTPERPNITRLVIGSRTEPGPAPGPAEPVTVVETTVDDLDPELWPGVLLAVRAAGAWDCWTTTTVGRHGRPGQVLTALCTEQIRPAVVDAVFRHSTTLGVRWAPWQRTTLPRITVPVPVGPPGAVQEINVKVAAGPGGQQTAKPELADAERVAEALGWPVRRVCEAALSAYHRDHPAGAVAP